MECNVATSIALEKLDAFSLQEVRRSQQVFPARIATEGDDGRMFEKKQNVGNVSALAEFCKGLLQAQSCTVVNGAEMEDGYQLLFPISGNDKPRQIVRARLFEISV